MTKHFLQTRILTARRVTLLFICLYIVIICLIIPWSNNTSKCPLEKTVKEIHVKDNRTVRPLLTLFTTFDLSRDKPYKTFAHRETIKNWASFVPFVKPVLFHTDADHPLVKMAANENWDIIKLTSFNEHGTPKLKPMFSTIFNKYDSLFYGFANGDILFCDNLQRTLRSVDRKLEQLKNNVLVIGQRKNVFINLKQTDDKYNVGNIENLGRNVSTFISEAIDYFIFSRENLLKWDALADVVIGRPTYDNYLVGMSLKMGVNVIDATKTLLALHLTAPGGLHEGSKNVDAMYNKNLIGRFRYASGLTVRARLRTIFDAFHEVFVIKRK